MIALYCDYLERSAGSGTKRFVEFNWDNGNTGTHIS